MAHRTPRALTELAAYLSLGEEVEEDALLRSMMEVGVALVKAEEGSLLLVDRDRRELVFRVTVGSAASERALRGQRVPLDEGIVGLVATTGEAHAGAPRYHGVRMPTAEPTATLAAPIMVGDEVIGVLTAATWDRPRRRGARFGPADLRLYTQFGQMVGLLLRQRLREESVRRILSGAPGRSAADRRIAALLGASLGDDERRVARIAGHLAAIARGRPDALRLSEELVAALAGIVRAVAGREDHLR